VEANESEPDRWSAFHQTPGTELSIVSPLEWGGRKYNHVIELFRKIIGE